jgi:hypothetical protein
MPSPSGEGQPDTPINHLNQGEVMTTRIQKSVFISLSIPLLLHNFFRLHALDKMHHQQL